jgi:hypothetical protein
LSPTRKIENPPFYVPGIHTRAITKDILDAIEESRSKNEKDYGSKSGD